MIDADRALRAFTDVVAVEYDESADVARIVTVSDCYYAFPDDGMHRCPDREYHEPPEGHCKHVIALEAIRGNIDVPGGWFVTDDLDERTDPEFELEVPDRVGRNKTLEAFADGGEEQSADDSGTDEIRIYGTRPDGTPKVERKTVRHTHSGTQATHRLLPPECAALVDGDRTPMSNLSPTERAWVRAETDGDVPDPDAESVAVRDSDSGTVVTGETPAAVEERVIEQWEAGQ